MKTQITILLINFKLSIYAILGIIFSFLIPIIPLFLIIGVSIVIDTVFGILRAKKLKQKITSRGLSKLISKMVLYDSAVLLFFCIEKFILGDIIGVFTSIPFILTKIVATTILFIELKSINENYEIISGVNFWTSFKILLQRSKDLKSEIKSINK
jgi:hypothetical protein